MYRHIFFLLVASITLFSCKNNSNTTNNWEKVYTNAYKNHDYQTAIVALNNLILTDSSNAQYIDSLAFYYLKKSDNYVGGKVMMEKGLSINKDNLLLMEFKSMFLMQETKNLEAREILARAYELSKKNKFNYMIATSYVTAPDADEASFKEFMKIINNILYSPSVPKEMVEANSPEVGPQVVELKALCYLTKAKLFLGMGNKALVISQIDSALMIQPNYAEANYYKEKLLQKVQ
ncbi:MAG: hypothetical protein HQ463_03805 [Bacteroidetes bacterium]|nr:hypothetical protein [Bacteroidota bacterium]